MATTERVAADVGALAPTTLAGVLLDAPQAWAQRVAIRHGEDELSYADLRQHALACAGDLLSSTPAGSYVGVCAEPGPRLAAALFGVLIAGCCAVPLDPELPRRRLAQLRELSGVRTVVGDESARHLATETERVLVLDRSPGHTRVPTPDDLPPIEPASPALCFFTSGSTGRPKCVVHSSESLLGRQRWEQQKIPLGAGDRVLYRTAISFPVILRELFWPLMAGASLAMCEGRRTRDPRHLWDVIDRHEVTLASVSPSLLALLLQAWAPGRGASLRNVLSGGESLQPATVDGLFDRLPDVQLHNLYGVTEALSATYWRCRPGASGAEALPIGFPTDMTVEVVDDDGAPVGPGEVGRLRLSGPGVALEYLNDPAETARRFGRAAAATGSAERVFHTSDRALVRPGDRALLFAGREEEHVKLRGYRIDLTEVEAALAAFPGVRSAAAVVRDDERLLAFVLLADDAQPRVEELYDHARGRLPAYMVPAAITQLDEMPLGSTGKTDKARLPDVRPRPAPAGGQPLAATPEEIVCEVVRRHLPQADREIDAGTDLATVGGDSLAVISMALELEERIPEALPWSDLLALMASAVGGGRRMSVATLAAELSATTPTKGEDA